MTCTFTGAASADPLNWNVANNWSCAAAASTVIAVPTIDDAVIIPSGKTVVVNAPGGVAFSLQVDLGANVDVNSSLLTIAEATTNKGNIHVAKDSMIQFGFNFPDSLTTNVYLGTTLKRSSIQFDGDGAKLIFFNHFVNEGLFDGSTLSRNISIAFQRDWTSKEYPDSRTLIQTAEVLFFGEYEQTVTMKKEVLVVHSVTVDKLQSGVTLNVGNPTSSKKREDLLIASVGPDLMVIAEMYLRSGILHAGKSYISMNSRDVFHSFLLDTTIWENSGGQFDGGSGVVFFGVCKHIIRGSEDGFNHIFMPSSTPAYLCPTGVVELQPPNSGVTVSTNTIEVNGGQLNISGNTFLVRGSGIGDKEPFRDTSFKAIDYTGKGKVIYNASAPTDIGSVVDFPALSFVGAGPYSFTKHPLLETTILDSTVFDDLNVSAASIVNIIAGKSLVVKGPFSNDGLIVPGVGSLIIHPADYAKFTDATGALVFEYTAPADVYIEVKDTNRNLDGTLAESINVTIIATSGGVTKDTETVTLTETGLNTGVFRGTIKFVIVTPITAKNGTLEMDDFGSAELTYTDLFDPTDIAKDSVALDLP